MLMFLIISIIKLELFLCHMKFSVSFLLWVINKIQIKHVQISKSFHISAYLKTAILLFYNYSLKAWFRKKF